MRTAPLPEGEADDRKEFWEKFFPSVFGHLPDFSGSSDPTSPRREASLFDF